MFGLSYVHYLAKKIKKKGRKKTLMFCKITFSFDFRKHLVWHCLCKIWNVTASIIVQNCIDFFFANICVDNRKVCPLPYHVLKILSGLKVSTLWWPVFVGKWCHILDEPLWQIETERMLMFSSWNMLVVSGRKTY